MTTTTEETRVLGVNDETFALSADELYDMANLCEKLERLNPLDDVTVNIAAGGGSYRVTCGWDANGMFGVLGAWYTGTDNV